MPPLIQLLRPHQWVKNGFVLIGPLFAHAWQDLSVAAGAASAFFAFCLLSSAVYIGNDFVDREEDRRHPEKRRRPLAAGTVSLTAALATALFCLAAGLALAYGVFSPFGLPASQAPWLFPAYLLLNVAYTLKLKHVVILDVFAIAAGFLLRILAGTIGLGIAPSHWLLLCGLMLTLFLGFAKRRAELTALGEEGEGHRQVLCQYSLALLDQFLALTAAATILGYSLYTVAPETLARHGGGLIVTVPCVVYGLLRYLWRLHDGAGGDPAKELLRDPHLMVTAFLWLAMALSILSSSPIIVDAP